MTTDTPDPGTGHGLDPAELKELIATDADPSAAPDQDPVLTESAAPDPSEEGLVALNKGELLARVKARTEGVRGREIRQVIDAVLAELGQALVAGEALKLPPLGTVKAQRNWETADADLVICKLRRKKPKDETKDPLAEPAEDG